MGKEEKGKHMKKEFTRKIILEDGHEFCGYSFGATSDKVAELVFNTSMAGYQEILSDPSYTDQAVVMTYPILGNYGMNTEDYETEVPTISALISREYTEEPSNFRSTDTLSDIMKKYDIAGIYGVDTRKIVRIIRDYGSCKVLITSAQTSLEDGLELLKKTDLRHDQVSRVSTKNKKVYRAENAKFHVVAIDCGMKQNIVRSFNKIGCDVTVVPWDTTAEEILALQPDGVFLSNGPGDPTDAVPVIEAVKAIKGKVPIFGICLGHQILCLAYGATTYKLKFGHRGGNHPVLNIYTDKVEITSQNHSYAVDEGSLFTTPLYVSHKNLLDQTVEGVMCLHEHVASVQYHPESAPGPQDSFYLFEDFIHMMEEVKGGAAHA